MSNIICFLARADIDLSVAMTTASSFGAIVMMPLNLYIYVEVEYFIPTYDVYCQ